MTIWKKAKEQGINFNEFRPNKVLVVSGTKTYERTPYVRFIDLGTHRYGQLYVKIDNQYKPIVASPTNNTYRIGKISNIEVI